MAVEDRQREGRLVAVFIAVGSTLYGSIGILIGVVIGLRRSRTAGRLGPRRFTQEACAGLLVGSVLGGLWGWFVGTLYAIAWSWRVQEERPQQGGPADA